MRKDSLHFARRMIFLLVVILLSIPAPARAGGTPETDRARSNTVGCICPGSDGFAGQPGPAGAFFRAFQSLCPAAACCGSCRLYQLRPELRESICTFQC